jgi:hypothetical protein
MANAAKLNREQVIDLLYQALETEMGGIQIYTTAIECAKNDDLLEEWTKYLEQTERHEEILEGVFETFKLDPSKMTPTRAIVRSKAKALVDAMKQAQKTAPDAAELIACECVIDAEHKDHSNWELIGMLAGKLEGAEAKALKAAHEEVEEEEDEHLYHSQGWCRELAIAALGLAAALPPPEEVKDVKTAIGAARAKAGRKKMAKKTKSHA